MGNVGFSMSHIRELRVRIPLGYLFWLWLGSASLNQQNTPLINLTSIRQKYIHWYKQTGFAINSKCTKSKQKKEKEKLNLTLDRFSYIRQKNKNKNVWIYFHVFQTLVFRATHILSTVQLQSCWHQLTWTLWPASSASITWPDYLCNTHTGKHALNEWLMQKYCWI